MSPLRARVVAARDVSIAVLAVALAACSSSPKPLPGGPPPEYEPARSYDGGVGEPPAAAPAAAPPAAAPSSAAPAAPAAPSATTKPF